MCVVVFFLVHFWCFLDIQPPKTPNFFARAFRALEALFHLFSRGRDARKSRAFVSPYVWRYVRFLCWTLSRASLIHDKRPRKVKNGISALKSPTKPLKMLCIYRSYRVSVASAEGSSEKWEVFGRKGRMCPIISPDPAWDIALSPFLCYEL